MPTDIQRQLQEFREQYESALAEYPDPDGEDMYAYDETRTSYADSALDLIMELTEDPES